MTQALAILAILGRFLLAVLAGAAVGYGAAKVVHWRIMRRQAKERRCPGA